MLRLGRRLCQGPVGVLEALHCFLRWVWSFWVLVFLSFMEQASEYFYGCLLWVWSWTSAFLSSLKKTFEWHNSKVDGISVEGNSNPADKASAHSLNSNPTEPGSQLQADSAFHPPERIYSLEVFWDKNQLHEARGHKILPRWHTAKDVIIKVRIAGKTGGCEQKFLKEVSKRLSLQGVSLRVEEFMGTSNDLLLVFCPIASRMGTDIENALEGLTARQKAVLVLMHYVQRDNTGTFVGAVQQLKHADVMLTVHTRYTLQEGFYPCEMNEVAVADVAAAIKGLA